MSKKYFRTDGVRGRVGVFPMTPEFVLKLGWAAGTIFMQNGINQVLIGKDTRISGYVFESALEAGLASAGVDVVLLGPMPTPGVAYLTRAFRNAAGAVISASHNPYYDNGVKFFNPDGTKMQNGLLEDIEKLIDKKEIAIQDSQKLGKASRMDDAVGRYVEFCKGTFHKKLRLNGLKLVVDTANGAAYDIAWRVFSELGADVVPIFANPDGFNINEGCGATHIESLQKKVVEEGADAGIALDGDADRLILVDKFGKKADGDAVLYLLATSYKKTVGFDGGVAGTVMTNKGVEESFRSAGIDFARSNVGDTNVMELMKEKGWILGGEESGHIICAEHTTTGDGIVAALQVLAQMVAFKKDLHEFIDGLHYYPSRLTNIKLSESKKPLEEDEVQKQITEVEDVLKADGGRILVRESGTEPLVRVLIEHKDVAVVEELSQKLESVIKQYA